MIGKESPRLQTERVVSRELERCVAQKIQLCARIEERLSMKRRCRDDVCAVGREIVGRRMRPLLAHKHSMTGLSLRASFRSKAMRGRIALQKHCVRNPQEMLL